MTGRGGYECFHVPTTSGPVSGLSGIRVVLILPVLAVLAWRYLSPWVVLLPLAVLAVLVAVGITVRQRSHRPRRPGPAPTDRPWHETPSAGAGRFAVTVLPAPRVGAGARVVCLGCQHRTAVAVLAVAGHRIPVCGPCQRVALARVAAGHLQVPR